MTCRVNCGSSIVIAWRSEGPGFTHSNVPGGTALSFFPNYSGLNQFSGMVVLCYIIMFPGKIGVREGLDQVL